MAQGQLALAQQLLEGLGHKTNYGRGSRNWSLV